MSALTSHWSWGSGGVSFQSHTCKTDDAGKFEFGGLWPGDQYQITVSARTAKSTDRLRSKLEAGRRARFRQDHARWRPTAASKERSSIPRASPWPSVRVFNSGDGPKPIETLTDEAGKFRLQGLRNGPVFVFAEKAGCRFTGLRTICGATDVVLKMLRTGEPVPPRSAPSSAARDEEERRSARRLLEKFLATGDDRTKQWARSRLAKLDSRASPEERAKGQAADSLERRDRFRNCRG